jgi:predicted O-methyltransferase YrrM
MQKTVRRVARKTMDLIRPLFYATLPLMAWIIARFVRGNDAFPIFLRKNLYLLRKHYYLPIPEAEDCSQEYWNSISELAGIEIEAETIKRFMDQNLEPIKHELKRYPLHREDAHGGFFLINGGFMAVDADMYYCLIRYARPRRIIEVGCGFSTMLASDAIRKNREEGADTEYICVEPYLSSNLRSANLEVDRFLEVKVQQVEMLEFTALGENDILFIDTTHVLKSGGDVQFLYCEILPRLTPGVLVHVHDISLPRHYPKVYFEESYYFWNEQYLLQAFLTHNARVEVIWPGNYMMVYHPQWMLKTFPEIMAMRKQYPSSEPSSFWFRIK